MAHQKPETLDFLKRNKDSIYTQVAAYAELHPSCPVYDITKNIYNGDDKGTRRVLRHLAKLGHKESKAILKISANRRPNVIIENKKIAAGIKEHPDLNGLALSKKLGIANRKIYRYMAAQKKGSSKKKLRSFMAPVKVRQRRVVNYFMKHPTQSNAEISKATGIPQRFVMVDIKKFNDKYLAENIEKISIVHKKLNIICYDILAECDDRLSRVKAANQGGRLMEIKLMTIDRLMKLNDLNSPQRIILDANVTKEQKDACVLGTIQEMHIAHGLNWEKMQISAPASKQIVDVSPQDDGEDDDA